VYYKRKKQVKAHEQPQDLGLKGKERWRRKREEQGGISTPRSSDDVEGTPGEHVRVRVVKKARKGSDEKLAKNRSMGALSTRR